MTPSVKNLAWIRQPPLADVLAVLDREGEEARVVGGAVRNALLGEPLGDIDIATTALPQEVIRRVEKAGFKAVPTGIDHGTVTVVARGQPFEVTTLREDVETYGRHAKVAFGRDWRRDAQRRDFTINALSLSPDGTLHDEVGGLADLQARRVRFIGEPARRIAEDYLRILRFFRFHASYGRGAPPDVSALRACIAARAGLATLSRERVRLELLKLLVAPGATSTLAVMAEAGLLIQVLGGVPWLASFAKMAALEARLALSPDAIRRLAALAVWVAEDAARLRERLRLANIEFERIASIAEDWPRIKATTELKTARARLYRLGAPKFQDCVLLAWSRAKEDVQDPGWRRLLELVKAWHVPTFPLRAADFLSRGVEKGPALGESLRAAEEAWIAADFPIEPAALDRIIAQALEQTRGSAGRL